MPLECAMLIIDNSKFSRNSDVYPTRIDAQMEFYSSIARQKDNDNPETLCSLMVSAGPKGKILMDPNEPRKINSVYKEIVIDYDYVSFVKCLQMAALCLNHRINKNQKQRIMFTVCSPIIEKDSEVMKLAKDLRRNNIAVDIFNLNEPKNDEILTKFNDIVNNDNNSKYINVNEYVPNLNNFLSNILNNNTNNGLADIEEDIDEDMAMAIKMSMEVENLKKEEEKIKLEENKRGTEKEDKNEAEIENLEPKPKKNNKVKDKEFLKDVLNELKLKDDDEEIKKLINDDNEEEDSKK